MGHDGIAPDSAIPGGPAGKAAAAAREAGLSAPCCSRPGPDLRYVIGYDAQQLERLTCLAVPADRAPAVPRGAAARAAGRPGLAGRRCGLEIVAWDETDDPYALLARRLGAVEHGRARGPDVGHDGRCGCAMRCPARGRRWPARPCARCGPARAPAEVAALRAAGAAIDRVHARVPDWLRPGRTELEVAADIAEAIIAEGHARVDFTIVASGPNGASPHHEASDRIISDGDPWSWTSAGRCRADTARTAPGPT